MSDNVPPSWTTPPWDSPETVEFEKLYELKLSEIKNDLANTASDYLRDAIDYSGADGVMGDIIYDELYAQLQKLWEN